jgi:phosphonate transport system permease protein
MSTAPTTVIAPAPRRPLAVGSRRLVLLLIAVAGLWAAWELALDPRGLAPDGGGLRLAGRFLAAAASPALTYEAPFVPEGTEPLAVKIARAAGATVVFAAAATSLSLAAGAAMALLASRAWWSHDGRRRGPFANAAYGFTRAVIALSRSVHELLWAVLFLAAMGLTPLAAVVAIAIPYSGVFAKVFSEMLDEAPRDTAEALRDAGASPLRAFLFGLVPRALPDMTGYAFYRFECALRSAAVLGFFGIPTLGYYVHQSFANAHYHEVWSYLYALFVLVVTVDWWSGAVRRGMLT